MYNLEYQKIIIMAFIHHTEEEQKRFWELMNRLPMFENCENDGLKNTIYFADRVVNIPSSVRPSDLSRE